MTLKTTREREPVVPITEQEQTAFCYTDLRSKPLEEELKAGVRWQRIPATYLRLTAEELDERIARARAALGTRVIILGHHYQRDEIIRFADYRGDSLKLSQNAASHPESDVIVFCGVHFMAETARVLCSPHQKVILPNITAGCSMADMAPLDDVMDAWDDLSTLLAGEGGVLPLAYVNSTASIKALCGRNGGLVCTSSNAPSVFKWAFEHAERVFFLPDQHLGRNMGLRLGIGLEDMVVWNPFKPLGGNTPEGLKRARLILWQGHCSVHTRFTLGQIQQARERYPDIRVIVHPECVKEVAQAADLVGSTEFISRTINSAPSGSKWAVGTEINLVNRLAKENPDKLVFCLDPIVCPCSTMYRIHPAYLSWVLDELLEGRVVNEITVDSETSHYARLALERMFKVM
jgi:quinolinate synthase